MLGNSASGPEIGLPGRISPVFLLGAPHNRPSGRPTAGLFCSFPDDNPTEIRPGSPIAGPETPLPNIGQVPLLMLQVVVLVVVRGIRPTNSTCA